MRKVLACLFAVAAVAWWWGFSATRTLDAIHHLANSNADGLTGNNADSDWGR